MKYRMILASVAILSLAAGPALAGDTADPDRYYYDDPYPAYDPYYDDPYYGSYSGGYGAYYPRSRRKYRRRGRWYGDYRHSTPGGGIQSPAQQGGMRGR